MGSMVDGQEHRMMVVSMLAQQIPMSPQLMQMMQGPPPGYWQGQGGGQPGGGPDASGEEQTPTSGAPYSASSTRRTTGASHSSPIPRRPGGAMLDALKGLLTPARGRQVRFRAVTESYDLIDTVAERVDTQLIVHSDSVSIRDREPVGLYQLKDHDSLLVWDGPIVVETGLFRRPEARSRWVLQEAYHIWLGYAEGTLRADQGQTLLRPLLPAGHQRRSWASPSSFCCIIAAVLISAIGGSDTPKRANLRQGASPWSRSSNCALSGSNAVTLRQEWLEHKHRAPWSWVTPRPQKTPTPVLGPVAAAKLHTGLQRFLWVRLAAQARMSRLVAAAPGAEAGHAGLPAQRSG